MKSLILTPSKMFFGALILGATVFVQWLVLYTIGANTEVYKGSCTITNWGRMGERGIVLNLNCGGKEGWTEDREAFFYCLRNFPGDPGPLTGTLWGSGKVTLDIPEAKPPAAEKK